MAWIVVPILVGKREESVEGVPSSYSLLTFDLVQFSVWCRILVDVVPSNWGPLGPKSHFESRI